MTAGDRHEVAAEVRCDAPSMRARRDPIVLGGDHQRA
jgi:hypothetical protein